MTNTATGQFVVMGVCGSGKSSVAILLALRTAGAFIDADDFHPAANKAKMTDGVPLTDADRGPWLDALNAELKKQLVLGKTVFLACSALKQAYRDRLSEGLAHLRFIYLKGSKALLAQRLNGRKSHFMPATLLDSQLATLEEPAHAITVSIEYPVPVVVDNVLAALDAMHNSPARTY